MAKVSDYTVILQTLASGYINATITQETIAFYTAQLVDIPVDDLRVVCEQLAREEEWFPPIAKIRKRWLSMVLPAPDVAANQWGMVIKAIYSVGYVGQPAFDDPITAQVVKALNWRELCLSENAPADRARFIEAYNDYAKRLISKANESKATRALMDAYYQRQQALLAAPQKRLEAPSNHYLEGK